MRIRRQKTIRGKYFYRDHFRRVVNVFQANLVIILVLTLLLMYFVITRPATTFYATDMLGDITTLAPQADADDAAAIATSRYDCIFHGKCTKEQHELAKSKGV